MSDNSPKISFIVPYFENHDLLPRALVSIDDHCGDVPHQIIIIDDASPTKTHLKQLVGEKYLIIENADNLGPGACRNLGAAKATGDYIFFLDSDDQLISNPWMMLKGAEQCDMVMGRYSGEPTYPLLGTVFPRETNLAHDPVLIKKQGFWSHAYRRDFLLEHAVRFPEDIRFGEDFVFLARALASAGSVWLTDQVTVQYNADRPGSLTQKGLSNEAVETLFYQMPAYLMTALAEHPDAYAIQFCMLFSKRLENVRVLENKPDARSFETAAVNFGKFVEHYRSITELDKKVAVWNIKWDTGKSQLAREIKDAEVGVYGQIIRDYLASY